MNEQERADWMARAIDDLVHGDRPAEPPVDLDGDEIGTLMRVARARLETARESAHAGLQYEGAVWQRVLERLEQRQSPGGAHTDAAPDHMASIGGFAALDEPERGETRDLKDIVLLRRQMSEQMLSLAEAHRDSVWQEVQSRIYARSARSTRSGFFSFLRRNQSEADRLSPALDCIASGKAVWRSGDPEMDGLVKMAQARKTLSGYAEAASAGSQERVWARIQPGLSAPFFGGMPVRPRERQKPSRRRPAWSKMAVVGAAAALVIAALGPIPATGLAHHPAAEFVRFVGSHIGVRETASAPPAPPADAAVIQSTAVSAQEAAASLGLPVREPGAAPPGFSLTSSQVFPLAFSAPEGGMFVLTYTNENAEALVIYQEAASGVDISVLQGTATYVGLADGTPATFIEGSWQTTDGGLLWGEEGVHSLVFERGGVRTTIRHSGGSADAIALASIADGMAPAGASAIQ